MLAHGKVAILQLHILLIHSSYFCRLICCGFRKRNLRRGKCDGPVLGDASGYYLVWFWGEIVLMAAASSYTATGIECATDLVHYAQFGVAIAYIRSLQCKWHVAQRHKVDVL
ncbi:hypothetical protein CEXT_517401 [Caerostris extrusa]|uniref:Uncharacterized protein n=1 Tax=Caerostris extrusa TaxID=172846 RepID=A0AAV4PM59_CAEEX|nr:hypothetical protein CEXT_517401 [Caerostris extrusa]